MLVELSNCENQEKQFHSFYSFYDYRWNYIHNSYFLEYRPVWIVIHVHYFTFALFLFLHFGAQSCLGKNLVIDPTSEEESDQDGSFMISCMPSRNEVTQLTITGEWSTSEIHEVRKFYHCDPWGLFDWENLVNSCWDNPKSHTRPLPKLSNTSHCWVWTSRIWRIRDTIAAITQFTLGILSI